MSTKTVGFDEGRAAQMSATFAVTFFLSLIMLLTKQCAEYSFLEKLLWTASGFFCATSTKLLDRIFDHNEDLKVFMSILSVKGRSLFSLDERWFDLSFVFYFAGWVVFLGAFLYVGILIFSHTVPQDFLHYIELIFSNSWLMTGFLTMLITTLLSATRELLFIN